LGLLVFYPSYVLAAEIAVCFTTEYGMTPSCTQQVVDALAASTSFTPPPRRNAHAITSST
jgi:hypothetical protein